MQDRVKRMAFDIRDVLGMTDPVIPRVIFLERLRAARRSIVFYVVTKFRLGKVGSGAYSVGQPWVPAVSRIRQFCAVSSACFSSLSFAVR